MSINFDPVGSVAGLEEQLRILDGDSRIRGIIVLACVENGFSKEKLDPLLTTISKPLVGGVFPNLIYQVKRSESICSNYVNLEIRKQDNETNTKNQNY